MLTAGLKLRVLVSSGEALTVDLLDRLQAALPLQTVILNIYGCTEVAADVTCCEAQRASQNTPVQQPQLGSAEHGRPPLQLDAATLSR